MKKMSKLRCLEYGLYAILIMLLPLHHVTRGIDFTDTGYSVMLFQNMDRRFGDWMLSTYLANRAGSVLMKLPGGGSYIGIRVYCLLLVGGMALGLYVFLSKYLPYRYVAIGVILALCVRWCPGVVLYNYLSYIFFYGAVVLLVFGCTRNNGMCFFSAGVLLGCNVFVRLPNITQCILILPLVFWLVMTKSSRNAIVRSIAASVLGYLTGVGVIGAQILIRYGKQSYINMIQILMDVSKEQKGYSGTGMMTAAWVTVWDFRRWLLYSGVLFLAVVMIDRLLLNRGKVKYCNAFFAVAVGLIPLRYAHYYSIFTIHDYTSNHAISLFMVILVTVSVIVSGYCIVSPKCCKEHKLLAAINLCVLFIAPIGSNTGFLAMINNLYFVAPFTLGMLGVVACRMRREDYPGAKMYVLMLFAISLIQSVLFFHTHVYGDMEARLLTKKVTENEVLQGVRVLEGMEPILTGVTKYVESNGLKGQECISFGNIPTMPFVLGMPTAISTSWPDLSSYPQEMFEEELLRHRDERPVVIVNRWYLGEKDIFDPNVQADLPKTKLMADYLTTNEYVLTYENDKFQIYR